MAYERHAARIEQRVAKLRHLSATEKRAELMSRLQQLSEAQLAAPQQRRTMLTQRAGLPRSGPRAAVTKARQDRRVGAGVATARPTTHAAAARLVKTGKYNELFAVGHQDGPVPKPLFSPGKVPFSYMPCKGTFNTTFNVAADTAAVIFICPQYENPMVVATNYDSDTQVWPDGINFNSAGPAVVGDLASWPGGGPTYTPVSWTGGTDPRYLVSGQRGQTSPPDEPYETPGSVVLQQQFMGGRFHLKATSSYNGSAILAAVDSKSFPASYGSKLTPTNTHGMPDGNDVILPNAPDAEDCMRWFVVESDFAAQSVVQFTNTSKNIPFVGAGDASSAHLSMNIGPEGQMWMPWSSNYSAGVGASGVGNAALGGIPARQPAALLALGYGFIIVNNLGSAGSVSVSLTGEFAYNVAIPTTGPGAVPVLAQRAPITTNHSAGVQDIHSVAVLHHDATASRTKHASESAKASIAAGVELPEAAFRAPAPVNPRFAEAAVGAGENLEPAKSGPLSSVVKTVGTVGKAVEGVSKIADVASSIGGLFGL